MGLKPSPYFAVQQNTRAKRHMLGDPEDESNVFRWDRVRVDGTIAAEIVGYVDDNRVTSSTEEKAWLASSRVAKSAAWLGLQDAARKRRPPSQRPGPWAGCVAYVGKDYVKKSVTQKRWKKTRAGVEWLDRELELVKAQAKAGEGDGKMTHKPMESIRGFLNYVARMYEMITPYLKGIHLTLDHWRPDRDPDGWRISNSCDQRLDFATSKKPPATVVPVSRLRGDIDALLELTSAELPPVITTRASKLSMVWFIFGDASGYGLSTTAWHNELGEDIEVDVGTWSDYTTKTTSSNWKEMNNFVIKLENMMKNGEIPEGTELWLFTDNFVTERAYHRGTSSSPQLFELVLRLRKLQMDGKLFLHSVWVAGTRMIEEGTDGGSRGDFTTGVLRGEAMLGFVLIQFNALERQEGLEEWLLSWFAVQEAEVLDPEGWFHRGHQTGNFIWAPAPAATDVAVELLCDSRHARPWNAHLFVCPALLTSYWRKTLSKVADCMITIQSGLSLWPAKTHEPLVIAIICPIALVSPWVQRGMPELKGAGIVCANIGYQRRKLADCCGAWHSSCYEQLKTDQFPVMSKGDLKRHPANLPGDDVLLLCIRRANLDACWARESSTVYQNMREAVRRVFKASELLGTDGGGYPKRGPFPVDDVFGMEIAAHHLLRSLDAGRNAKTIQFQTMRHVRSHYANFFHTTPMGVGLATAGGWETFGSQIEEIDELLKSLELLEEDWQDFAHDTQHQLQIALLASTLCAGFSGGLRGEEVPRADLGLVREHWKEAVEHERAPHVPWAMVGRFKNETGEKVFYQPLAIVSKSGIENGKWIKRAVDSYAKLGIVSGPFFRVQKKGGGFRQAKQSDLDPDFTSVLLRVQARWPNIIPPSVNVQDEYSIRRSLRRGSTTQAGNMQIPKEVIEANNRWRKHGNSRGVLPGMPMVERYSDAKASIMALLRYSLGL
eukprot:scaffold36374_cov58-Attheya_sp.AAC.7